MVVKGTLIGDSDGHTESRQFSSVEQAKQWCQGAGLVDFTDQTAHGEVRLNDDLIWVKSGLQMPDQRERDIKRYAANRLALWGLPNKKHYL